MRAVDEDPRPVPHELHPSRRARTAETLEHGDFGALETRRLELIDRRERQRAVDRLVLTRQRDGQMHELARVGHEADSAVRSEIRAGPEAATELDVLADHLYEKKSPSTPRRICFLNFHDFRLNNGGRYFLNGEKNA